MKATATHCEGAPLAARPKLSRACACIPTACTPASRRQRVTTGDAGTVLACGMLSSTCGMLGTYPLNVVRTRLQASGMPGGRTYTGPADVVRQAVRAGGLAALYQGLVPNMLKVLPATSISYAVYDCLQRRGGR